MPISTHTQSGLSATTSVSQRAFKSRTVLPDMPMLTMRSPSSGYVQLNIAPKLATYDVPQALNSPSPTGRARSKSDMESPITSTFSPLLNII